MDQLFIDFIGKPHLGLTKIVTIVAENFSFLDNQAKFLKAILAIPFAKQSPLIDVPKHLIQIGPSHSEVEGLLNQDDHWIINKYQEDGKDDTSLCDRIDSHYRAGGVIKGKSLIFINDASTFLTWSHNNVSEQRKFLRMIDTWKRSQNHLIVVLFQQSCPVSNQIFLRDLEFISDACVRNRAFDSCYKQSIWHQPIMTQKTMLPSKVETNYYTFKIGRSFHSPEWCFTECVRVAKNYDPDLDDMGQSGQETEQGITDKNLETLTLDEDESDDDTTTSTLPYIRAQNPEQSCIFYYQDKDEDIDEEDPDNDLDI